MRWFRTISIVLFAAVAWCQAPVLRPLEPADNRFVSLPGAKIAKTVKTVRALKPLPAVRQFAPPATVPAAPEVELAQPAQDVPFATELPAPPVPEPPPVLQEPPPPAPQEPPPPPPTQEPVGPPAEFQSEIALFLQKQIGWWSLADARKLLGNPERQRAALNDKEAPTGTIYAYSDPTGRYREIELDFDAENGNLRTVFVYPKSLTWQECHRQFNGDVSTTQANKGRTFYSYVNRKLDVLVDPAGQVISLGLY
jgi:hypothetical protein